MNRKLYIELPYRARMPERAKHAFGFVGFQFDGFPNTDGDILEVTFRDGRYDPTSVVIHEGEEE